MKTRRILLVDDDADDRLLFCEALEEIAPEIICDTAEHARKALASIQNQITELPELIFVDINMPVMSGWQFLSFLKEQDSCKQIPVIMYSTSSHQEDINKARELGALCFFSKPNDFEELKDSLRLVSEHLNNASLSSLVEHSPVFVVPHES